MMPTMMVSIRSSYSLSQKRTYSALTTKNAITVPTKIKSFIEVDNSATIKLILRRLINAFAFDCVKFAARSRLTHRD